MNILFVYSHGVRPTRGGTERVIHLVSKALENHGHQVYYLSLYESVSDLDERVHVEAPDKDDEKIADFMAELCARWKIEVVVNEIGEFCDYAIYSRIGRNKSISLISCVHFDVLGPMRYFYSDNYSAYKIKSLRACFSWVKYAWNVWKQRCEFVSKRKSVLQKMLSVSDCVVVPSEPLLGQLRQFCKNPCRMVCIPNPIFSKVNNGWAFKKKKQALYVGRLVRQKHVERIIEAWHMVGAAAKDWKLVIAGSGEMEQELRSQIDGFKLQNVEMVGHVQDVQELYQQSSVSLLASDHESFSLVLAESLAYGCYPICFDFPAAQTLLARPEWGERIREHSVECMADVIRNSIREHRSNETFYPEIAQHMRSFSPELIGNKWHSLLKECRRSSE